MSSNSRVVGAFQAVKSTGSDCLAGDGEACELARAVDWGRTAVGGVATWSQALRSTASLVLHNHSGMLLWWGPEFVQIYNDAYRPVLGDKHPRAMGQRFRDCWTEVFHILGPMAERPFRGGPASVSDDIAVPINRKVAREEAHFRLAYSPVPDDSVATGIGGVLATVTEISEQAYADRQTRTLRELGERSAADAQTAEHACVAAAGVLGRNSWDVPFALIYLLDETGGRARLVASSGFDARTIERVAPAEVDLALPTVSDNWMLREVAGERRVEIIPSLASYRDALPQSPWSERPGSAIALPLAAPDQAHAYGVLICGISPHRVLDAGYRTFFELAAAQMLTALRDARALEEERKRAAALASLDRAKTAFFSNISHEFRTPLTLLLGPLAEVAGDPAIAQPARELLDLAHRNALRLLKLVNSLLDFSRIEAGRVQASYEPTDLADLTRDLASTFRSALQRAGLAYDVDCADLGEPVYVDREMWEKIVLNLLSNAFKYTLRGSITVRQHREGAHVVLEVSDTGVGIPERELPRLFERFHRVEGTAGRTQEGTGIGLALVQELVKLHGGTIGVSSMPGRGTTFRITVPLSMAHLPAERIKAPRALSSTAVGAQAFVQEALRWIPDDTDAASRLPALSEPPATHDFVKGAGARILLADDNADMRAYVQNLLSPDYLVEVVSDGEQALQAARRDRPDLIVSDVMMPRLDGLALLKALRADGGLRDVPVVLLSARAGEEARVEGLNAGADDYLVKPFSARELLARIGGLLELMRTRRESEARFHALVSATSEVVYRMSPDWSEMRFLQGRNFIADTGDPSRTWLDEYLYPDDQPRVMAKIREAIRTKSTYQLEHRVRRVDGTVGWVFSRAVPLQDVDGEIIEWFGAASDVTERKETEQALASLAREREQLLQAERAARAESESANHMKDDFLATVSHELRTPLSTVISWSRVLQKKYEGGDTQLRRGLSVIVDNARLQARIISDLLDMNRIVSGKIQLELVPTDLGQLVETAVESLRPSADAKRINLEIDSDSEPVIVDADATRLRQVLWNLLSNAIKFTPEDGRVTLQIREAGDWAGLIVSDSGIGIPAQFLPHVFDRFRQAEGGTGRRFGGLGLGLAIVKQLVELHGGEVHVSSDGEGRGSTFTVRLPLERSHFGGHLTPEADAEPIIGHALSGMRILAVEDDTAMLELLTRVLTEYGAEVTNASSAAAALEALGGPTRFDLILSDIGLPKMDGYELMRSVRKKYGADELPAIAVTAFAREQDRELATEAGFQAYLVKPYEVAKVIGLVRRLGKGAAAYGGGADR